MAMQEAFDKVVSRIPEANPTQLEEIKEQLKVLKIAKEIEQETK